MAAAETFSLTGLLGGLGLLLLGMWLLTEGLSVAGGVGLRKILGRATRSRFHGLLAGFLITALLQSSGAVMVAVIGFVNAGVLELARAIWLILGSNVGTSVTGWLVALVGFRVDVAAYALPLVGAGMLLRLTGPRTGRGALGLSLVGMAVFFFGLGILKSTFQGSAESLPLHSLAGQGFLSDILFLLAGIVLTVLMQSSSAAIAVVL
ncbi:MAG: Na/Pi symporter, partial [Planctomycetota bacterium]